MTERIRVLWLTPDKPANVSVGRHRIADHLSDHGFDVTVRGTTLRSLVRSLRKGTEYDVVVGTTRAGAIGGTLLKLVGRVPLIVDHVDPIRQFETTHSRWVAAGVRALENVSFRTADHVLYVYEEETSRVRRHANSASRTHLGVEFERFADPDSDVVEMAVDTVETLGLDGRLAIYVGGLEPIYRVRELIEAVDHLDDWSLLILGDGDLAGYVADAAETRDDLAYPGSVPHETVPGYLAIADVGVSLVDDPHTLKVLEYGAAGLPVVQAAGRAEDRFGDLVEYCGPTPESIATAIERAGDHAPTENLRSFSAEFDWRTISDGYAETIINVK